VDDARGVATARVLLVENDSELGVLVTDLATAEASAGEWAAGGHPDLHGGLTRHYDLLVLDRRLPAMDGLDLLGRLRSRGVTPPALILSALGSPADRVEGLDGGADDYLPKPFDVAELLARLRALRRRHLDGARMLPLGAAGARCLDLDARQVVASGRDAAPHAAPIPLSDRECALLAV